MKIKPLYIYLGVFIAFIAAFIIFSGDGSKSSVTEPSTSQMPNDDIHKGIGTDGNPSSSNVNEATKKKFEALKAAYESNPSDTANAKQYADWLSMAHNPDKALEIYENILKVGPKRTDIMLEMTFLYFNRSDMDKAESITKKILQIDPKNRFAEYNLGAIAGEKGDKAKAKEIWQRVIKKYPNTEVAGYSAEGIKMADNAK